jgi:CheY-like chemotaxis protein
MDVELHGVWRPTPEQWAVERLAAAPGLTRRVLVADDEAPIRLLCRIGLEAAGVEVTEAADGLAALASAQRDRPDAILLDLVMPRLDGWETADALLADPATASIPIVFFTARTEFADRARRLEVDGVDYLTKPFDPDAIAPLIERLIERTTLGGRSGRRRERIAELRDLF